MKMWLKSLGNNYMYVEITDVIVTYVLLKKAITLTKLHGIKVMSKLLLLSNYTNSVDSTSYLVFEVVFNSCNIIDYIYRGWAGGKGVGDGSR